MEATTAAVSECRGAGPARGVSAARWRRVSAMALVVLFGVLAPLGLIAGWSRATLLDTGRYVETVAPLAGEPAIRRFVAAEVTGVVVAETGALGLTQPGDETEASIAGAVTAAVESERFRAAWRAGNRLAHRQVLALLTGKEQTGIDARGGRVVVDLTGLYPEVQGRLAALGIAVDLTSAQSRAPARVTVFASDDLAAAQRAVRWFDRLGWGIPVAVAAVAGLALLAAPSRWRTLRRAGIALAAAMAAAGIALLGGRALYLGALDGSLPRGVAAEIFDELTRSLWYATVLLCGAGLAMIAVAVAGERRGRRG